MDTNTIYLNHLADHLAVGIDSVNKLQAALSCTSLIAMAIVTLSSCHAVLLGSATEVTYEETKDERSASEVAIDARIVGDIKQKLIRDKDISGWDVNFDSYKGEVTLHGNISNQLAKERTLLLTQSVKGVMKVVS